MQPTFPCVCVSSSIPSSCAHVHLCWYMRCVLATSQQCVLFATPPTPALRFAVFVFVFVSAYMCACMFSSMYQNCTNKINNARGNAACLRQLLAALPFREPGVLPAADTIHEQCAWVFVGRNSSARTPLEGRARRSVQGVSRDCAQFWWAYPAIFLRKSSQHAPVLPSLSGQLPQRARPSAA